MPETNRLHYLDPIRIIAIGLLVIFHAGLVFTPFYEFVITNSQRSLDLSIVTVAFLHPWHMPLLFFVSGMSTYYSLKKRQAGAFALERVKRLLVPFIFGVLILVPPQVYFDLTSRGRFDGSLWAFYRFYFTEGLRYFTWHHLWFVLYLFVITLTTLPLTRRPEDNPLITLVDKITSSGLKPLFIFLGALPIIFTEILFRAKWSGLYTLYSDWANLCLFTFIFLYGYLTASNPVIRQALYKTWKPALITAAIITSGSLIAIKITGEQPLLNYDNPFYYVLAVLNGINVWSWMIGLVGLAHRFANRSAPLIKRLSSLSYPFYLLHQTVLVFAAYYIIQLNLSIPVKFLLIVLATFTGTTVLTLMIDVLPFSDFFLGFKRSKQKQQVSE